MATLKDKRLFPKDAESGEINHVFAESDKGTWRVVEVSKAGLGSVVEYVDSEREARRKMAATCASFGYKLRGFAEHIIGEYTVETVSTERVKRELPAMFDMGDYGIAEGEAIRELMTVTTEYPSRELPRVLPNTPEKAPVFSLLPIASVTKKEVSPDVRERSRRGFVWVDSTSFGVLFNKYGSVSSCHTLDSDVASGEHKGGNYTYAYSPYVACVFAHSELPADSRDGLVNAESAITGNTACVNGKAVSIRPFQATALVYFMRDSDGRPFLVLSSVYDSCYEYPWEAGIFRYLLAYAKRAGIGFAVNASWRYCGISEKRKESITRGVSREFRTPLFSLPFGNHTNPYGDGFEMFAEDGGTRYAIGISAYVVSEPRVLDSDGSLFGAPSDYSEIRTYSCGEGLIPESEESCRCSDCGERMHGDDSYYSDYDGPYCESCFYERFTSCYRCGEYVGHDYAKEGADGESYCESCFDRNFTECEICESVCEHGDSHAITLHTFNGESSSEYDMTVCESCESYAYTECSECGESCHVDYNDSRFSDGFTRESFLCYDCKEESKKGADGSDDSDGSEGEGEPKGADSCIRCGECDVTLYATIEHGDRVLCLACASYCGVHYSPSAPVHAPNPERLCYVPIIPKYTGEHVPQAHTIDSDGSGSVGSLFFYRRVHGAMCELSSFPELSFFVYRESSSVWNVCDRLTGLVVPLYGDECSSMDSAIRSADMKLARYREQKGASWFHDTILKGLLSGYQAPFWESCVR